RGGVRGRPLHGAVLPRDAAVRGHVLHQHRRRLGHPPHEAPVGGDDVTTAVGEVPERATLARLAARNTRRNFAADKALAVASGAALLILLLILAVILVDVVKNGTPHLS